MSYGSFCKHLQEEPQKCFELNGNWCKWTFPSSNVGRCDPRKFVGTATCSSNSKMGHFLLVAEKLSLPKFGKYNFYHFRILGPKGVQWWPGASCCHI